MIPFDCPIMTWYVKYNNIEIDISVFLVCKKERIFIILRKEWRKSLKKVKEKTGGNMVCVFVWPLVSSCESVFVAPADRKIHLCAGYEVMKRATPDPRAAHQWQLASPLPSYIIHPTMLFYVLIADQAQILCSSSHDQYLHPT